MRIAYIVPAAMSKGALGVAELRRREGLLNGWAFAGTTVEVFDVPQGPASLETSYEQALCVPPTVDLVRRCERDGFDAAIIGCFTDPGLDAAREMVEMPVVGPCESAMLLGASLGHRFSVLTLVDGLVPGQELLATKAGVRGKLASTRVTGIMMQDLMKDCERTRHRLIEVAHACVKEDRADVLLLGCMTMSFLDVAEDITAAVGVPTVNVARAALKQAETVVALGLSHSKTAYPSPALSSRLSAAQAG